VKAAALVEQIALPLVFLEQQTEAAAAVLVLVLMLLLQHEAAVAQAGLAS
jgi:hypothetical protein